MQSLIFVNLLKLLRLPIRHYSIITFILSKDFNFTVVIVAAAIVSSRVGGVLIA